MKKLLLIFLVQSLYSCGNHISEGRTAYKEYLKDILKDPSSLIIHSEDIISKDDISATFVVDIGAKNSYGGYARSTYTFKTVGSIISDVKDYDIRLIPKPKAKPKKVIFTYKEKGIGPRVLDDEKLIGKKIILPDDILAGEYVTSFQTLITILKERDNKHMYSDDIDNNYCKILKAGTQIVIESYQYNHYQGKGYFRIKHKGESLIVEPSSIL